MRENRELLMAALLCDLERFYGAPAASFVREHRGLFQRYLDVDKLAAAAEGDPRYRESTALIEKARELSLMESARTKELRGEKNLTTVFSRIRMDTAEKNKRRRYDFQPLTPKACFPMEEGTAGHGIGELRDAFKREMEALSKEAPERFEDFLVLFDGMLERFLWCITAADYEGEDISLYAHLKNTAVIAMCSWMCAESGRGDGKDYCLAMADFSGIQNYIFAVNNVNERGVAKRLRARSFMVDAMVTVLSHVLLHRFGASQLHTLLLTGGKFYLLLPNVPGAGQMLAEAREEFNRYVFRRFKGQIAVNLVWTAGGAELLEDYSGTVAELSLKLSEEKTGSFRNILQDGNGWQEDAFELYRDLGGKKICPSCGSELIDKDVEYCENCRMQEEIGGLLPRTRYISYSDQGGAYPIYEGYGITLSAGIPEGGYLVEKLNDPSLSGGERKLPVKCRFMANHIPTAKGGPKTFSEIAQCAKGDKKLGVLKADVDTLGFLFASGLRDVEAPYRHYGTISRTATMSRLLVVFFSGYVDLLLDTDLDTDRRFRDIYCVFSGGDDLFLIGPWDVMCDFALEINRDFRRFTGNNRSVTLSAAVELFQPRAHISFMAEKSEEALKLVKNDAPLIYPEKHGRDAVSCLGASFSWEDFRTEWERAKGIASWWQEAPRNRADLPVSRMDHIQEYSRMYQVFLEDHDILGLMCSPYLEYDIQRNYNWKKIANDELQRYIMSLSKNAADYRRPNRELYFARFCMSAVRRITKEVRTNGE